jgi:putative phosphoesterase
MLRIGLISDTHGLLRPEALDFLRASDHIVHAGDIGSESILEALRALAPLTVVRGNTDHEPWTARISETDLVQIGETSLYVIHDLAQLDLDPRAAGIQAVIYGHTHKPLVEDRNGVLYVNPGAAGPRRFKLPISVGELIVEGGAVTARLVELSV